MKVDLIYLARNRREFTVASLRSLIANTTWSLVSSLTIYDDGSTDGTQEVLRDAACQFETPTVLRQTLFGNPVAVMLDFLRTGAAGWFARIDNNVIVPPGWLERCVATIEMHPQLDLLGIEAPAGTREYELENVMSVRQYRDAGTSSYARCDAVGAIGLMRAAVFQDRESLRQRSTDEDFADWQRQRPRLVKGWILPPIKLFLLDRLPHDPWSGLSRIYAARGWQRPRKSYGPEASALWAWWRP